MSRFIILTVLSLSIFSCCKNIPRKLSEDILCSNLEQIDSVLNANRPVTSYFIDSITEFYPSFYFSDVKEVFDNEYFFIGESVLESKEDEFYFSYRFKDLECKFIFIFQKNEDDWIFKGYKLLKYSSPHLDI